MPVDLEEHLPIINNAAESLIYHHGIGENILAFQPQDHVGCSSRSSAQ
jgi:hypothetical protein